MVLVVVRRLDGELGVIGVVSVELELSLQGTHVLSVNLVGQRPEDTLPDQTCLRIL